MFRARKIGFGKCLCERKLRRNLLLKADSDAWNETNKQGWISYREINQKSVKYIIK